VASANAAITNFKKNIYITVYPNPINQYSVISYQMSKIEPVRICVNDLTGRTVAIYSQNNPLVGENKIDLKSCIGELQKGIYLIHFYSNSYSETLRIVKL